MLDSAPISLSISGGSRIATTYARFGIRRPNHCSSLGVLSAVVYKTLRRLFTSARGFLKTAVVVQCTLARSRWTPVRVGGSCCGPSPATELRDRGRASDKSRGRHHLRRVGVGARTKRGGQQPAGRTGAAAMNRGRSSSCRHPLPPHGAAGAFRRRKLQIT